MKVLLCERLFTGHRKVYMEGLSSIPDIEFYCFAPENIGVNEGHFYKFEATQNMKSLTGYLHWVNCIRDIVKKNTIDAVHILDGDSIRRFFGIGFKWFGAKKVAVTYHHFFPGKLSVLSYFLMSHRRSRISVVHTNSVKTSLKKSGIKNVRLVEYPAFNFYSISNRKKAECKQMFNLPTNVPTIGIIGGMSGYKYIIQFLEIMNKTTLPFYLLICGKEAEVKKEELLKAIDAYSDQVTMKIQHLTDDEYESAIMASDIIYSIYGLEFDGASGPLTDGVCAQKMILSCAHGSLGEIVVNNHLGYVANCLDRDDILNKTENALDMIKSFQYDEVAQVYRERLMPENFQIKYKSIYKE